MLWVVTDKGWFSVTSYPYHMCHIPHLFLQKSLEFWLIIPCIYVANAKRFCKKPWDIQQKWSGKSALMGGKLIVCPWFPKGVGLKYDKYFMENYVYARV